MISHFKFLFVISVKLLFLKPKLHFHTRHTLNKKSPYNELRLPGALYKQTKTTYTFLVLNVLILKPNSSHEMFTGVFLDNLAEERRLK